MAYTRRHFARLLQGGAAIAAAGFPSESFAAGPLAAAGTNALGAGKYLDKRHFEAMVGSGFRLSASQGESRLLTLLAVESTTHRSTPAAEAAFVKHATPKVECSFLRFSGEGAELPEGIYLLEHETAGAFPLYLNPGRPGRYLAFLAHVPEDYLQTISIPRRAVPLTIPESTLAS